MIGACIKQKIESVAGNKNNSHFIMFTQSLILNNRYQLFFCENNENKLNNLSND